MSRHQDTGVSARFPCLAIGRGGEILFFTKDATRRLRLTSPAEAPKYSVDLSDISGLASEELTSGSGCCLSSPSFH